MAPLWYSAYLVLQFLASGRECGFHPFPQCLLLPVAFLWAPTATFPGHLCMLFEIVNPSNIGLYVSPRTPFYAKSSRCHKMLHVYSWKDNILGKGPKMASWSQRSSRKNVKSLSWLIGVCQCLYYTKQLPLPTLIAGFCPFLRWWEALERIVGKIGNSEGPHSSCLKWSLEVGAVFA